MNNSTNYSSTNKTPTQVIFGFRTREALDLLRLNDPNKPIEDFGLLYTNLEANSVKASHKTILVYPVTPYSDAVGIDKYRLSYINAKDAIAFAAIRIKDYYNTQYKPIYFDVRNMVYIRLYKGYKMPGVQSKKTGL